MRALRRFLALAVPVVLAFPAMLRAVEPAADGFQHFVTRQDGRLLDGEKPFRFIGANMPGLVLPYDWTLYLPERLHLPTAWEQEDAFKTLDQMNFRVVRLWNLPMRDPKSEPKPWHYVLGPDQFNEEAFVTLDRVLALANKYHVRVIIDFSAEAGDYLGGIGTYAAHRGKKREAFWTDPQLRDDYKATLRHVLTRVNTVSHVPYRDDKAVLAWQFGNEMHSATDAWLAEMAAYIKSLDPNHLVAETRHVPGQAMADDPNIDMVTRHLYGNYKGVGGGWPAAVRGELAKLGGRRPMFIGEYGPYIDGKNLTAENVVEKMREFLDFVREDERLSGALVWSMYFHHQDGGYYWHQIMTYPAVWSFHWPGFPSAEAQRERGLLDMMRTEAFAIENRQAPPIPIPDAPELLPIGDVPLLSWRGSAGASGYDVQRGEQAAGPWTTIADNMSDADTAYRPLLSDTTARPGGSYYYRVTARNASGVSPASNVVGPVAIKRLCLVDELMDFSRAQGRSEGLALNNDYNAVYAEYLFRAKGKKDDQVTYAVPGSAESVKAVAFFAGEPVDPSLEVSTDGTTFVELKPSRQVRRLPSPPGGAAGGSRRTMVEYQADVSGGGRFVRIRWNAPAELDRVEIYYH
jgi:mannan endo-1,4-beta-mannosidase